MAKVLNDILLFSCIAAFVTGIVLAAASLLTRSSRRSQKMKEPGSLHCRAFVLRDSRGFDTTPTPSGRHGVGGPSGDARRRDAKSGR